MSTCPCHEWLSVHQIIRDKITKKKSNGSAFLTYFIFSFLNSSHVFLTLLHIFVYLVCNPCTRFISELLNSLFLSPSFPFFTFPGCTLLFYETYSKGSPEQELSPRYALLAEDSIVQAVPEHPKRENVFCLSNSYGDVYLFQVRPVG